MPESDIVLVCPTRAEKGPMASVSDALPKAAVMPDMPCRVDIPGRHYSAMIDYCTGYFMGKKPKLVVALGDRFETHAAAMAAYLLRIPIAHIHGGETTVGSFDDGLRHGITHMAKLHFVATQEAADRVFALQGNNECGIGLHVVGAPGLDTIQQNSAKRDKDLIVVSYYPETNEPDYGLANCKAMLKALEPYTKDHSIFFSRVNSDPGAELIHEAIDFFMETYRTATSWITPSTREQYLHLLEHAKVCIGNSSSLVIETPWIGVPSVLIGNRQNGRPVTPGICRDGYGDLTGHIQDAIDYRGIFTPIYHGGAAEKIAKICREYVG